MPLFMDRHYTKDATRTAIETAHARDLKIQENYGVRFLTYWFDEDRHTTFCLIEAPDEELIRRVHAEAHGDLPHEIISVDANEVSRFLGRLADPAPQAAETKQPAAMDSAFRVIVFTDLKGSTEMTARLGDHDAMHLLRIHNALIRDALRAHSGSEVKHTGDGFMLSFRSAESALNCAIAIQRSFAQHRRSHPADELHVRIGMSCGEPVEENNDLFGAAVQTAARVCGCCQPDEILVDTAVRHACGGEEFWRFGDLQALELKGLQRPIKASPLFWE